MRTLIQLLVTTVLLTAAGACEPDLGDMPVLCNTGEPQCPRGYTCASVKGKQVCVRDGLDLGQTDF